MQAGQWDSIIFFLPQYLNTYRWFTLQEKKRINKKEGQSDEKKIKFYYNSINA